jgi:hypothetical protein
MKVGIVGALLVLLVIGLGWVFMANDVARRATLGVASADADRAVYERSKSFIDGTALELGRMKMEYLKSHDEDYRKGLRYEIVRQASKVDRKLLPQDIQDFLKEVDQKHLTD